MKRIVVGAAGLPAMSWTMGRSRPVAGLGALAPDQANVLRDRAGESFRDLDTMSTTINNLAATGNVPVETIHVLFETRAALRQQLDVLMLEIENLESAGLEAWNVRLAHIEQDIGTTARNINALMRQAPFQKATRIIFWTSAAVIGAVGAALAIRYFGRRRRG